MSADELQVVTEELQTVVAGEETVIDVVSVEDTEVVVTEVLDREVVSVEDADFVYEQDTAIHVVTDSGGSGVTDHGLLLGLGDDDHLQYHTDARGDARYSLLGHNHAHNSLTGLQGGTTDEYFHLTSAQHGSLGALGSFTQGSVVFAGASGVLAQDNANLFWDDTNNQLKLAATGSGAGLLIGGDVQLYRSAANVLRTPDTFQTDVDAIINNIIAGHGPGSAASNTVFGEEAFTARTTGTNNLTFGFRAGRDTTIGTGNVYIGNSAGRDGIAASGNVAIGNTSLTSNQAGGNSVSIGEGTLATATQGENIVIGNRGFEILATGLGNIGIGHLVGRLSTSGGGNILIGRDVQTPTTTSSNSINIGNTILGNLSTGVIRVATRLSVGGADVNSGVIHAYNTAATGNAITVDTDNPGTLAPRLHFRNASTTGVYVSSDSNVGIEFETAGTTRFAIKPNDGLVHFGTWNSAFVVGDTTSRNTDGFARFQLHGTNANVGNSTLAAMRWSDDAFGPRIILAKARGATVGTDTIVQNGDVLGSISALAADGGGAIVRYAAQISFEVDGTPGVGGDMPGRMLFKTSPDGSSTLTESFRVDNGQKIIIGGLAAPSGLTGKVQIHGNSFANSVFAVYRYNAGTDGPNLFLGHSKSGTLGTNTIVAADDFLGSISFMGADGTGFIPGAEINAYVDGTPGTNDMPTRLVFATTADGASTATEAFRIDSTQKTIFQVDRALRFNNQSSAAGAGAGTLANAPTAGDPGYWLKINIGGTNYAIPAWAG